MKNPCKTSISASLTAALSFVAFACEALAKPNDVPAKTAANAPAAPAPAVEKPRVEVAVAAAMVDQLVEKKLSEQKLQPNPLTTDEVFLRRIYLDIIGRVPTKKEALDFLNSKETDKRPKLIDQLLASDGYEENFFNFWADVLRLKSITMGGGQTLPAGLAYTRWVKDSLRTNKPYDQFVRELLTAQGKTYENGAVGFYIRDYNMPLDNMAVTSQIFLGAQIVCAQCHNHPFDKWTQMDYYKIAAHSYDVAGTNALLNPAFNQAVYGGTKRADPKGPVNFKADERKEISKAMTEILRPLRYNTVVVNDKKPLRLPHDYKYPDGRPLQVIEPVIPASMAKDGKITKPDETSIEAYAKWMTSPDNARFSVVIANRIWKKVMGMGIIEPVDQITDSTVPSNPALMEFLESTMKKSGYDMKAYLRILFNTSTYQRKAYSRDIELGEAYYFPGPLLRRLSAEEVWDSLVALYKPAADKPSRSMELETDQQLIKIEWWDRALNNESVDELLAGARRISEVQKKLSEDVRKAQVTLKEAQAKHDEAAIREAKKASAQQRKRIDEAVERIVYDVGFEKFADLAKKGQLRQQVDDPEFAKEIRVALKQKVDAGQKMDLEEALQLLIAQKKRAYDAANKVRREREMQAFKVQTKIERSLYQAYASGAETVALRAADLRSPAPNGHFLRVFGQSDRELVTNANGDASVMQALMLLNGKYFKGLLNPYTVISRHLKAAKTPDDAIDTIFLSLLSRHAAEDEKKLLRPLIASQAGKPENEACASALWAVLNTREFLFEE